jgi:hypothetical protein
MKKFIVCTMLLLAVVCGTSVVCAAKQHQTKVEKTQAPIPTEDTSDTTAAAAAGDASYVDSVDQSSSNVDADDTSDNDADALGTLFDKADSSNIVSMAILIPIIGTICGCLLIALVIFLIFYFRYKNRQAKYRLAEKALEAGKPMPEGVFSGVASDQSSAKGGHLASYNTVERDKGIQNAFLGLGLFIFLWAITGSFGIGCIGLLVMFIGIGRWYTALEHRKDAEMKNAFNEATKSTARQQEEKDDDMKQSADGTADDSANNVKSDDSAAE